MKTIKAVWAIKNAEGSSQITWNIVNQSTPYKCGSAICNLCLLEKLEIFEANPNDLLNKHLKLILKCHHHSKFKLCNFNVT